MPGFLAGSSIAMWFVLMLWVYLNSPEWFFVPFFIMTTIGYMKMMEAKRS
jgi:hypothetical protein